MNTLPLPFYHPTTIALVDDNLDFLINLSLQLNENTAFTLHHSPRKALKHLNNLPPSTQPDQKYMSMHTDLVNHEIKDNVIVLDTSKLINELYNPARFQENSVLIVDYAMPHMNGIEFCKMLANKNMKKILLTGVADEKIAIRAFNDGVIDKYLKKSDDEVTAQINSIITTFQRQYFQEKTALLKNILNASVYGFLVQPHFIEIFNRLLDQHDIVEYYLTSNPGGYIMISATNKVYHLIVVSKDELDSHAEIVTDQEGPIELHNLLRNYEIIPNFKPFSDCYSANIKNWKAHAYPACPLLSRPAYFFTIIESPDYFQGFATNSINYENYLASLDDNIPH